MKENAVSSGVLRCQSIQNEILRIFCSGSNPEIYSRKNYSYFSLTFRLGFVYENRHLLTATLRSTVYVRSFLVIAAIVLATDKNEYTQRPVPRMPEKSTVNHHKQNLSFICRISRMLARCMLWIKNVCFLIRISRVLPVT